MNIWRPQRDSNSRYRRERARVVTENSMTCRPHAREMLGVFNGVTIMINWTVLLMANFSHVRFAAPGTLRKVSSDGAGQTKARGGDRPRDVPLHRGEPRAGGSLGVREAL